MKQVYAVLLHGERVGSIQRHGFATRFLFDREYWQADDRHVLGQWFETRPKARWCKPQLLPWFSNLLPEGRLRDLMIRQNGIGHAEVEMLARIGEDLPGGGGSVVLDPAGSQEFTVDDVAGRTAAPVTPPTVLRASLAGMALKFSLRRRGDRLTVPAHGKDGDWILKTPDPQIAELPANELTVMRLAGQVGIEVPEVALWDRDSVDDLGPGAWPTDETQAYAIRRFDRSEQGRIHMEDFAQVLGRYGTGEWKYRSTVENVANFAYRGHDHASLQEMVRRTVFNLLAGNGDAHLKNWSLIYPDRRTARLSPAYDLVCTAPYLGQPEDPHLALPFFGARTVSSVSREHFARLQDVLRVGREDVLDVLDETLERFRQAWEGRPDAPDAVTAWISAHLEATSTRLHGA